MEKIGIKTLEAIYANNIEEGVKLVKNWFS